MRLCKFTCSWVISGVDVSEGAKVKPEVPEFEHEKLRLPPPDQNPYKHVPDLRKLSDDELSEDSSVPLHKGILSDLVRIRKYVARHVRITTR